MARVMCSDRFSMSILGFWDLWVYKEGSGYPDILQDLSLITSDLYNL